MPGRWRAPRPAARLAASLAASLAAALVLIGVWAGPLAAQGQGDVFDQLFGTAQPAKAEERGVDDIALPSLFAQNRQIADALAVYDLEAGAGGGDCVALEPLLGALELEYSTDAQGGFAITLPQPQRVVTIRSQSLGMAGGGPCLALDRIADFLPFTLAHDRAVQCLSLTAHAALPVLMRIERERAYSRLRPKSSVANFAVTAPEKRLAQLWSADLTAGLAYRAGGEFDVNGSVLASGELLGLAARARIGLANRAGPRAGVTLSDASAERDLLGPLGARSFAIGDVVAPAQPLISDSLAGRGLVISSRAPWRVDLVDRIELAGPLAEGWEAELWQDDRLVAICREGDAAGNWRFADLNLRTGRNRWVVRLHGPHGEA